MSFEDSGSRGILLIVSSSFGFGYVGVSVAREEVVLNALKSLLKFVFLVFKIIHLVGVVVWHREPRVIQHLLGCGSILGQPF